MDLIARPLDYRWKVTESEKKDNDSRAPNPHQILPKPPPGLQQQPAQQMQHREPSEGPTLCFLAAIVKVLLVEEETKLQNDNHFRYVSMKCRRGITHGFVDVPNEYRIEDEGYLIVLSNDLRGSTLPFSDSDVDETSGGPNGAKSAYNVMLVDWRDGIATRRGIGIFARGALECRLPRGPTWDISPWCSPQTTLISHSRLSQSGFFRYLTFL
jgi:hypothetical protein